MKMKMKTTTFVQLALCATLATGAGCAAEPLDGETVEDVQSPLNVSFTALTLQNGWTGAPFGTGAPAVGLSSGIVYLKGAMKTTGTNPVAFTLASQHRPSANVYLPVNLCGATKGRLAITPGGTVTVVAEGGGSAWANAQCFTSLDGVSYAVSSSGYTPLTLKNGWTNAPFSTRNAAVTTIGDIVHLVGAIKTTGTNAVPFTLPIGFAPSFDAYLPLDLCDGAKGRLWIDLGGRATVVAEGSAFSKAQCFTSLEGVSYPLNPASGSAFTCLDLQNGWVGKPFNTRMPCVRNDSGIVRLLGAVNTTGTSPVPIRLPAAFRPARNIFVEIDLCDGAQGRILVESTGAVTVQPKGAFWPAQCFTSLEGVQFGL